MRCWGSWSSTPSGACGSSRGPDAPRPRRRRRRRRGGLGRPAARRAGGGRVARSRRGRRGGRRARRGWRGGSVKRAAPVAFVVLLATASPAAAGVSVTPSQVLPGQEVIFVFAVPNENQRKA